MPGGANIKAFSVRAPGKVILFGEHAVVHGIPAIAASVALYTYLTFQPDSEAVELDFPDVGLAARWDVRDFDLDSQGLMDETLRQRAVDIADRNVTGDNLARAAAVAFAFLYLKINRVRVGGKFTMTSELPIGAGLGSSASFSTCLAATMLILNRDLDAPCGSKPERSDTQLKLINEYAFLGEKCIHGNPSGIDNLVTTFGGAVHFQRGGATRTYEQFPELRLILTDTGVPRMTSELVASVAQTKLRWPQVFEPVMQAISELVSEADHLVRTETDKQLLATKVGELAELNHGLLVALSVSHASLEHVRAVARDLAAGSTKLTGAGGGGCAITIATPDLTTQQVEEFRSRLGPPYRVFETTLGGPGVSYSPRVDCDMTNLRELEWCTF